VKAVPKQPDRPHPSRADGIRGRVGEVEEWDRDRCLDLGRDLMHRVGAQDEEVGARALQPPRSLGEHRSRLVPLPRDLHGLDLGEVNRRQNDPRRVQATQALADQLVGEPVVDHSRLPTHPADHPDDPRASVEPGWFDAGCRGVAGFRVSTGGGTGWFDTGCRGVAGFRVSTGGKAGWFDTGSRGVAGFRVSTGGKAGGAGRLRHRWHS
jgi:hypothetical protein